MIDSVPHRIIDYVSKIQENKRLLDLPHDLAQGFVTFRTEGYLLVNDLSSEPTVKRITQINVDDRCIAFHVLYPQFYLWRDSFHHSTT